VEAFQENAIDEDVLPDLSDQDLASMGVLLGHRKKLLKAIAARSEGGTGADEAAQRPPTRGAASGERRQLTVMFVDLVGSTALSRQLDPEEMSAVIRGYQNSVAGEIARFEGHVAKFMGDGVLVYFGYPQAHEDDAERAVRAGLAVSDAVGLLADPSGGSLGARIGIATGLVVVGDLTGEGAAQEESVVGDTPNLAARLQALAGPGDVAIAPATRLLLGDLFDLDDLGERSLKGLDAPVRAWRVLGESVSEGRFEALHSGDLTPLVGREEELDLLLRRWQQAKDGEGQVVLLSGEAGIGKSRIIQALRARSAGDPHTRLRYFCSPYHVHSALYPVIGQLERAAGFLRNEPSEGKLRKLETLLGRGDGKGIGALPHVAALLSIPSEGRFPALDLTPQQQKTKCFEALLEQLDHLAQEQPVLQIVEDAHWIDPTSSELFELVASHIQSRPVLLVFTFRLDFTPPWTGYDHVTSLTLNRLGRNQGAAMIERTAGEKALPDEVLDQILAKSDGVPLFVEELTRTVLESGLMEDAGDRYVLREPLPLLAIPASLQDTLMARLDRLAEAKDVAQLASALGRTFNGELLAAVSTLDETALASALAKLIESGLLHRHGVGSSATYEFKHALVQDAAYHSLLKSTRKTYHERIAKILEEKFPEIVSTQPELVAFHYSEAQLFGLAIEYWRQAAQRAKVRSANMEAIAHGTKGLELISRLPESSERNRLELALQLTMGPAVIAVKGYGAPEVIRTYSRARELCQETGDLEQLFETTWGLWISAQFGARITTARGLCEDLLTIATEQSEPSLQLQAHHANWTTMLSTAELASCRQHAQRGVALYELEQHRGHAFIYGGHDPGVCAFNHMSQTSWFLGYAQQAVENSEFSISLAEKLTHPLSLLLSHSFAGWLHNFRREPELVGRHAEIAIKVSDEHGIAPHYRAAGLVLSGWALSAAGETEEGMARIRDGLEAYRASGTELRRSYLLSLLAEAHVWAGQRDEALEIMSEAFAHVETSGERRWEADLYRLKGTILLSGSKPDQGEAERCFLHAVEIAQGQGAKVLELRAVTSLARMLDEQGRHDEAQSLLAPVYDWFTEGFDTPDLKDAKALLNSLA
jgi:class 3 adenylate cyclase/predicted ATPase